MNNNKNLLKDRVKERNRIISLQKSAFRKILVHLDENESTILVNNEKVNSKDEEKVVEKS